MVEIGCNFMIILLQFVELLANDAIYLLLGLIHKLSEYLHDSLKIFFLLQLSLHPVRLQSIQKALHDAVEAIDLSHINSVIIIPMIELEESINSAKVEQITAERMRKSSRLLRDCKSQQRIDSRQLETGKLSRLGERGYKNWNWQQQKYSQLLKLMSYQRKQEREHEEVVRTLDHSDHSIDYLSQHFKRDWKPSLQSEMLITHCKQHRTSSKYPTQQRDQLYRNKSRHQCVYFRKDRSCELKLFKSHIRSSHQRQINKRSKPSFLKHMLKIEDQPLRLEENTPKFNEQTKTNVTLSPLKKVHQRLKSLTPQRPKQTILEKKSMPLKLIYKRNHAKLLSDSLKIKKSDLSAWTFHNIEQQN